MVDVCQVVEQIDRDAAFGHAHDVEVRGIAGRQFGGELSGDGTARIADHAHRRGDLGHTEPLLSRPDAIEGLVTALLASPVGEILPFVVRSDHAVAGGDVLQGDGHSARLVQSQQLEGVAGVALRPKRVVGLLVGDQSGGRRRALSTGWRTVTTETVLRPSSSVVT